jgi:hypothetical protein
MSIEAMKMALDALEKLWDIIDDIDTYSDMAKADDKLYRSLVERRQSNRFKETGISTDGYTLDGGAIAALRQAIEQAEKQGPVAYYYENPPGKRGVSLYKETEEWQPLYTAPPKREWVGLTDEEVDALLWKMSLGAVDEDVRTIEAKLKEKNT